VNRPAPDPHQAALLDRLLVNVLGPIDDEALGLLRAELEWLELPGGSTLLSQGDPGDAMYLCVSGRLRAYRRDEQGQTRRLREMGRGEVIGELSLYTHEPRSATVVAVRDSMLVRLSQAAFDALVMRSAAVSVALTRQIVRRQQRGEGRAGDRPVTVGLVPISAGVDGPAFAAALAAQMSSHGRVRVVDASSIGLPETAGEREVALAIARLEADCDCLLLLADDQPSAWTQRVCQHGDELLLLADADQKPALHATETRLLSARGEANTEAAQHLVLLHPAERPTPRGTAAWLARRPLAGHLHIRPALARDMARLGRVLARQAVGLVLAGGGARGLSHLGLLRALQERGVEFDSVGGTSIGAVMATFAAADQPLDRTQAIARQAFISNPTGDINFMPFLSLVTGRRLRRVVSEALHELLGPDPQLEDLWKPCFIVASNYTQSCEQLLQRGPLARAILASTAIPGALPPVMADGDLLCDGGTFNNFPVDQMRAQRGIGQVIGADLHMRALRRLALTEVPGPWALLRDRFRPFRRRKYRLPSLMVYLLNVTILYSASRAAQAKAMTDLYFNPPMTRVGMLAWHRFDHIVEIGYDHAIKVLDKLRPRANAPDGAQAAD
jgi:NTE family protein